MSKKTTDAFWAQQSSQPIERRVVWQFGKQRGELSISIAAGSPVPDLAGISEGMAQTATLQAAALSPDQAVAPQLVFAAIQSASHSVGVHPVVIAPGHREVPVVQLGSSVGVKTDTLDYQTQMKQSGTAMPPAQVAVGDHAVGFLVRTDVLHFYPLAAIDVPEEIETYREGAGSTADLIHVLPFQS